MREAVKEGSRGYVIGIGLEARQGYDRTAREWNGRIREQNLFVDDTNDSKAGVVGCVRSVLDSWYIAKRG